jgi:cell division protein FtsQ
MPEADERRREREEPEASPYLRRSKRVEVRRAAARWKRGMLLALPVLLAAAGVAAAAVYAVDSYLSSSPRFALREGPVVGEVRNLSRDQLARVFDADTGRSVFDVPLEERRGQLLAISWVEDAWVVRGLPNRLRVEVKERTPVAFVRAQNGTLALIDRHGVLLPLPRRGKFPYPVLSGVSEAMPLPDRAARVGRLLAVLEDLDRDEPRRSGDVSEIDLSDPQDAAITVAAAGSAVLVHLGDRDYLERYKYFLRNIDSWREQNGSVRSVDLRYEGQVIVR